MCFFVFPPYLWWLLSLSLHPLSASVRARFPSTRCTDIQHDWILFPSTYPVFSYSYTTQLESYPLFAPFSFRSPLPPLVVFMLGLNERRTNTTKHINSEKFKRKVGKCSEPLVSHPMYRYQNAVSRLFLIPVHWTFDQKEKTFWTQWCFDGLPLGGTSKTTYQNCRKKEDFLLLIRQRNIHTQGA
jgi:hypothetical protein